MNRQLIEEAYEMHKLNISEKIKSFDCGDTDLNDFILNESFLYREALLAVSYVFENKMVYLLCYIWNENFLLKSVFLYTYAWSNLFLINQSYNK